MANPFAGLVIDEKPQPILKVRDGEITSTTPLMVRIDGDEESVEPTKPPLVAGLAIGDKVLLIMADRQLIINGRYGG